MENLKDLMEHMRATWRFDKDQYPQLAILDEPARHIFVIRHSLMHLTKIRGELSELHRYPDLDPPLVTDEEREKFQDIAVKLFVNGLNIAREVGYGADLVAPQLAPMIEYNRYRLRQIDMTLGHIAGVCEDFDHYQDFSPEHLSVVRNCTMVLLQAVASYAMARGLSADELIARAPDFIH